MWKCVLGFNFFSSFFSLFIVSHFLKRVKKVKGLWFGLGSVGEPKSDPFFWLTLGLINVLHVFMSLYPCGFQANMFTKTRSLKAMSVYSVIWQFFLDIAKFVIYGSELVEIDTLFALCRTFVFGGYFVIFSKMRFVITSKVINRFFWFQIANTGWSLTFMSLILKKIGAKLRPWECQIQK